MKNIDNRTSIYSSEIIDLMNWFSDFFGQNKINRFIRNFKKRLEFSKYIYREYYLKKHHPWANALLEFDKNKSNFSIENQDVSTFLADIKMLKVVHKTMPQIIQNKCKSDLLDFEHAVDYLFEIKFAWQFYKNDFKIKWYEENNKPEYEIGKDGQFFDVECKRISVDAKRSIKRTLFYRFVDFLVLELADKNLTGTIDVTFKNKVKSNDKFLKELSKKIAGKINIGKIDVFENGDFIIKFNVDLGQNIFVDLEVAYSNYCRSKSPWSLGILLLRDHNGNPTDPLQITVNSIEPDHYLSSIYDTLTTSLKTQLTSEKPSLLACFIPEVQDFSVLSEDSAIYSMTKQIFLNQNYKNLIGIIYMSDVQYNPGLFLLNTKYPVLKLYNNNFMNKELITKIDSVN